MKMTEEEVKTIIHEVIIPENLKHLSDEDMIIYCDLVDLGWENKLLGIRKFKLQYRFVYDEHDINEIKYCNLYSESLQLYEELSQIENYLLAKPQENGYKEVKIIGDIQGCHTVLN